MNPFFIKQASKGDFEFMRIVMGAIANAKRQQGELHSKDAFFITVNGKDVLVVNSRRFPSSACLSKTLIEGILPVGERPKQLERLAPADFVVAMAPSITAYETVLFHELIHSQQIRRMWERRGIDLSHMEDREVMEGWRDRNLPIPRSTQVDEEYGSTHAEIHAFMMHTAYEFLSMGLGMLNQGKQISDVEPTIMKEMTARMKGLLGYMRGSTRTLLEDSRAIGFIDNQLANYNVDPALRVKKPRWRMSDEQWNDMSERMIQRMTFLVVKNLRDFARANR